MGTEDLQRKSLKRRLLSCVAAIALIGNTMAPVGTAVAAESPTLTPIKHVIVIVGENRTFDHIFATYKPVNKGEKVLNLLSKGIVKADGTPGPNYGEALQYLSSTNTISLRPRYRTIFCRQRSAGAHRLPMVANS
jgi:phospholipase C